MAIEWYFIIVHMEKCFYLILEGKGSVLILYEFKLRLNDKQVLKYMYYLFQYKEYELIIYFIFNNSLFIVYSIKKII